MVEAADPVGQHGAMTSAQLTGQEISDGLPEGWVYIGGWVQTRLRTRNFVSGLALLNQIGAAAEEANHHPDLDLRYGRIDVRMTSHDVGGVTSRDLALAARISELAAAAGVEVDGAGLSVLELALDTPEHAAIKPFWAAVLGLGEEAGQDPGDELRDRNEVLPPLWFHGSGTEEVRQRWHPDVWVSPAEVEGRIDAALAAGGSLVSDGAAPSFWVLADPDGNRMCLCTWQERG